jgi:hypothetical protein
MLEAEPALDVPLNQDALPLKPVNGYNGVSKVRFEPKTGIPYHASLRRMSSSESNPVSPFHKIPN